MTAREAWRRTYRRHRIVRRICGEAAIDTLIYGTGFVVVDETGIRSVPPQDVVFKNGQWVTA